MQWMVPEERLGSDQNEVIEEISKIGNQTIWIKGHAGSGKSVVLIQSIKDYLANYPNAKICVVVFANALLDFITEGLKQVPQLEKNDIPVITIYSLYPKIMNGQVLPYDAIFCDEVQDVYSSNEECLSTFCNCWRFCTINLYHTSKFHVTNCDGN
jgi:hypothetical protein